MQFIKKHWKLILIILTLIRFLLSYKLPSFYLSNLRYDDKLMVDQLKSLLNGNYLGAYSDRTLVKGIIFPYFLFISNILKIGYSPLLTILYIIACIFFVRSLKPLITDKKFLIIIYLILLFNPISYSSDLFQRMYRNSLSVIELYFFLGLLIRIVLNKKDNIIYYLLLGLVLSTMYLTREDTIWASLIIVLLIFYNFCKNKKLKTILISLIPFIVLYLNLNIVSYINYKHYKIYTYNELKNSDFKKAYKNILSIKDEEKLDAIAIPKSTLYKLASNSKVFNLKKEELDIIFKRYGDYRGEIYNGNIVWYLRYFIFNKNKFHNGFEANKYYKELNDEVDLLFKKGVFKKELTSPSTFIYVPTKVELVKLPIDFFKTIFYTSSYKNVKTITNMKGYSYGTKYKIYNVIYTDYHDAENIVKNNVFGFEIIRLLYSIITIILTPISLVVFFKNIKIKDKLNLINIIIFIIYLIITAGVSYTNTTAFPAIRYIYLGNVYILQNLFICLNIYRIYQKISKSRKKKYSIKDYLRLI